MDFETELTLRADTAAEAHLASTLKEVYEDFPNDRFDEEQINALRQTFILGWVTGFRAALKDGLEIIDG